MQTHREEADELQRSGYLSTEQLYRAHRPFVARFLTRLGVRPESLDDAVQEVFVTVHRRGGYVHGAAKPTSYLATIAINTAAAQCRSARTQAARRSDRAPEDLAARGDDPVQVLETQEELQRLDRALSRLDPTLRETLLRADGEGQSCVAIADSTAVPLGTVYWRLDRARKKFREALRTVDRTPDRTRDRPGRRRVGMILAWLGGGHEAGKAASTKVALGLGAGALVASVTLMGVRGEQPVTTPRVPPTPTAQAPIHITEHMEATVADGPRIEAPAIAPVERVHESAPVARSKARAVEITRARPRLATRTLPAPAPAPVAQPSPAAARPEPTREVSEAAQLARAEALLHEQPREALALVRSFDRRESTNYLREERDYIELMALFALEEREQARERAGAFLRSYPASAFARVVQARLGVR